MEIKELKDGLIYMCYTSTENEKCAILFPFFNRVIYDYRLDFHEIKPICEANLETLRDECEELYYENDHELDSYDSIDAFLEEFAKDQMEQWEEEFGEDDEDVLSINGEYKFSLLVGEEMSETVCEKVVKAERAEN